MLKEELLILSGLKRCDKRPAAVLPDPALVHRGCLRCVRVKLDLAKSVLVLSEVLLQHSTKRLRLLRAEVDPLEVAYLNVFFRGLVDGAKQEEKIPDVDTDLNAVRVGFAIVWAGNEFYVGLIGLVRIKGHRSHAAAWRLAASNTPRHQCCSTIEMSPWFCCL